MLDFEDVDESFFCRLSHSAAETDETRASFLRGRRAFGFSIEGSELAAILGFGILRGVMRRSSIVENNINQTIASAVNGASADMKFSVPAMFILVYTDFNIPLLVLCWLNPGFLAIGLIGAAHAFGHTAAARWPSKKRATASLAATIRSSMSRWASSRARGRRRTGAPCSSSTTSTRSVDLYRSARAHATP